MNIYSVLIKKVIDLNKYLYAIIGYSSNYLKAFVLIAVYSRFFIDIDLLLWYNIGAVASIFSIFELGIGKTILRDLSIAIQKNDFFNQLVKYSNLTLFIAILVFTLSFLFFTFYSYYYLSFNNYSYRTTLGFFLVYLVSNLLSFIINIFYYPLYYSLGRVKSAERNKIFNNIIYVFVYLVLFNFSRLREIPIWVHLIILLTANLISISMYHLQIEKEYRLNIKFKYNFKTISNDLREQSIFVLNYIAFHLFTNVFILYISNNFKPDLSTKIIFSLQFVNTVLGMSLVFLQVKMRDISILFAEKKIEIYKKTVISVIQTSAIFIIFLYTGICLYYLVLPNILINKDRFVSFNLLSLIYLSLGIESLSTILSQILLSAFNLKYIYIALFYSILFTIAYSMLISKIGVQNFFILRCFTSFLLLLVPNIIMLYNLTKK